ncbi:hypothetical protein FBU31_006580, partial [Coemansia sp. 'formosensis']
RLDFGAVPRIVEHMKQKSSVRFNIDMLRMVLGLEYPFDLKCALIKATLGGHLGVKPDYKLLELVVRMAVTREDVRRLPEIVDLFERKYGVELMAVDCDCLAELCARLSDFEMSRYWIGVGFARTKLLPNPTVGLVA